MSVYCHQLPSFPYSTLDMTNNLLTGTLPSFISNLTNLVTLSLAKNKFTSGDVVNFTRLTQLQTLELGTNRLSGAVPVTMSKLAALRCAEGHGRSHCSNEIN